MYKLFNFQTGKSFLHGKILYYRYTRDFYFCESFFIREGEYFEFTGGAFKNARAKIHKKKSWKLLNLKKILYKLFNFFAWKNFAYIFLKASLSKMSEISNPLEEALKISKSRVIKKLDMKFETNLWNPPPLFTKWQYQSIKKK